MIKQQHKLLKYHMLPVQVPGRSSNRRCRSRVTSDRAFGPARPDVRYTSNSDQILQSSEMSRRANKRHRAESFDQSSAWAKRAGDTSKAQSFGGFRVDCQLEFARACTGSSPGFPPL
jgi:hypothetical protein